MLLLLLLLLVLLLLLLLAACCLLLLVGRFSDPPPSWPWMAVGRFSDPPVPLQFLFILAGACPVPARSRQFSPVPLEIQSRFISLISQSRPITFHVIGGTLNASSQSGCLSCITEYISASASLQAMVLGLPPPSKFPQNSSRIPPKFRQNAIKIPREVLLQFSIELLLF